MVATSPRILIGVVCITLVSRSVPARMCWHPDTTTTLQQAECPEQGSTSLALPTRVGRAAAVVTFAELEATYDRDVTYIERLPRYFNYCVELGPQGPARYCDPSQASEKRWPSVSEMVTYRAHVRNKGGVTAPGASVWWYVNGALISTSSISDIPPGGETTTDFVHPFAAVNETIRMEIADPDILDVNNSRQIDSHAIGIWVWVEQELYDYFNTHRSDVTGTYSSEDWLSAHFELANTIWGQHSYGGIAGNGTRAMEDKMFVDCITVTADPVWVFHENENPRFNEREPDGTWQTAWPDCEDDAHRRLLLPVCPSKVTCAIWENGAIVRHEDRCFDALAYASKIDWGLLHEAGHYLLELPDEYNAGAPLPPHPNFRVTRPDGSPLSADDVPPTWPTITGRMGGHDTWPWNDSKLMSRWSVWALNTSAGLRRGVWWRTHIGAQLWHTPTTTRIQVRDDFGQPIAGAMIRGFQLDANRIDNIPELNGVGPTDANGIVTLPNRAAPYSETTPKGYRPQANPFGQIRSDAANGRMLIEVSKPPQLWYRWLTIYDLNMA